MRHRKSFLGSLVAGLLVLLLAFPVWALDAEGDGHLIPGFETSLTDVDTTQSVTTISVLGTGLGLYPDDLGNPRYGYGTFSQQGSGFMVNNYIITAAHVINPTSVMLRKPDGSQFQGPLIHVREMLILVGGSPAKIFHIDIEQDYAILVFDLPVAWVQNLKMKAIDTFEWIYTFLGMVPENRLHVGDKVVAIVRVRDELGDRTVKSEVRIGIIISERAFVPQGYEDNLPWWNLNDFTTDILLLPGDSGSPIIGFLDGKPCLIGIGRAAGYWPNGEYYSYATRIDFVKLVTDSIF